MADPELPGETPSEGPSLSVLLNGFGRNALVLCMDLEPIGPPLPFSPVQRPHWTDADRQAFGGYLDFMTSVGFLATGYVGDDRGPAPSEPLTSFWARQWLREHVERDQEVEQRFPQLALVHDGLPITDDERAWIRVKHRRGEMYDADMEAAMGYYRQQRAHPEEGRWFPIDYQIIALGDQYGVIDARDLVRRWAAWRRGVDEFTDRSGFKQAREALLALGEQLAPEGSDIE